MATSPSSPPYATKPLLGQQCMLQIAPVLDPLHAVVVPTKQKGFSGRPSASPENIQDTTLQSQLKLKYIREYVCNMVPWHASVPVMAAVQKSLCLVWHRSQKLQLGHARHTRLRSKCSVEQAARCCQSPEHAACCRVPSGAVNCPMTLDRTPRKASKSACCQMMLNKDTHVDGSNGSDGSKD